MNTISFGLADDVFIMHKNIIKLQQLANKFCEITDAIGLKINPNKCFSIHMPGGRIRVEPTPVYVCGTPVRALTTEDSASFLGKPIGLFQDKKNISEISVTANTIMTSNLGPGQKIDAMKTFLYPAFNYKMRTGQINKTIWNNLDHDLCKQYKEILNLPERASTNYVYGHQKDGLFGIPLAGESCDIAHIENAFKLLTSPDETVKHIAWAELRTCLQGRSNTPPTADDIGKYLSSQCKTVSIISSEWSRACAASDRLKITWNVHDDYTISISYNNFAITNRSNIFKMLRNMRKSKRTNDLKKLKNEGRSFHAFSRAKVSSHFNRAGDYLRFTDWRFVHPARLNLLKLNGNDYKNKANSQAQICRKCGRKREILCHVLNHCNHHMQSITARHNRIVDRITIAAQGRWHIYKKS